VGSDGNITRPRIGEDQLRDTFADFIPVGKAASGNRDVMAMILKELDAQWYQRPEIPSEAKKELMRRILSLLDVPSAGKIVPSGQAGLAPEILQGMLQLISSRTGGAGLPSGTPQPGLSPAPSPDQVEAPAEVINQPPSTTNPGGLRTIPIPGV
jgi:hypothetical protein